MAITSPRTAVCATAVLSAMLPARSLASLDGGYMARRPGSLAYLRVTHSGTTVKGYLQQLIATNNQPAGYENRRDDVTGLANGSSVMLKIDSFLGQGTKELDGTYSGGKLRLAAPANTGEVLRITFAPVSVEEWNRAVQRFRQERARAMQAIAQAEARREEQDRRLRIEQRRSELGTQYEALGRKVSALWEQLPAQCSNVRAAQADRAGAVAALVQAKAKGREIVARGQVLSTKLAEAQRMQDQTAFADARADLKQVQGDLRFAEAAVREAEREVSRRDRAIERRQRDVDRTTSSVWDALGQMETLRRTAAKEGAQADLMRAAVGRSAVVTAEHAVMYGKPDVSGPKTGSFARGTPARIAVSASGFYGIVVAARAVAWVRTSDVAVTADPALP